MNNNLPSIEDINIRLFEEEAILDRLDQVMDRAKKTIKNLRQQIDRDDFEDDKQRNEMIEMEQNLVNTLKELEEERKQVLAAIQIFTHLPQKILDMKAAS